MMNVTSRIRGLEKRLEIVMCERRDNAKEIKRLQREIGIKYVALTETDQHYALTHRFTFQSHAEISPLVESLLVAERNFDTAVEEIIEIKEALKVFRKELAK